MKLYGRNPVIERLRANPQSIRKIYIEQGHKDASYIWKKAKQWGIPVHAMPRTKMQKMARNSNTQGIMVEIGEFDYVDYADMLDHALAKKRCPVFLDGLNDPQNLGAIMRSLACLGKFSIVIHTHKSVSVTETVLRVASGGDNYVPVARVANVNNAIKKAKDKGFTIAGTVINGGQSVYEINFPQPLAVVIGSEQKGIRDIVKKNLDLEINIPMAASTLSLNAAQAAGILAYEIERQKRNG